MEGIVENRYLPDRWVVTYSSFPSMPCATVAKCSALAFIALARAPCFPRSRITTVFSRTSVCTANNAAAVAAISRRAVGSSDNWIRRRAWTRSRSCDARGGTAAIEVLTLLSRARARAWWFDDERGAGIVLEGSGISSGQSGELAIVRRSVIAFERRLENCNTSDGMWL